MYKIPAKTLFLGQNLVHVPECHSTNTLLREWLDQKDLPEGTVVITETQTAGRGQRGNSWESAPGKNLTFSILFKPDFLEAKDQFYLTMVVSLAVAEAVRKFIDDPVAVKWPNDIMVGDRKVCGILIESTVQGTMVTDVIVGIGLNVNQSEFTQPHAVSLTMVAESELNPAEVLEEVLTSLESNYSLLRSGQHRTIKDRYMDQLYWHRQPHIFEFNGAPFVGMIAGVDPDGRLCIQSEEGMRRFMMKEIRYKA